MQLKVSLTINLALDFSSASVNVQEMNAEDNDLVSKIEHQGEQYFLH